MKNFHSISFWSLNFIRALYELITGASEPRKHFSAYLNDSYIFVTRTMLHLESGKFIIRIQDTFLFELKYPSIDTASNQNLHKLVE